MHFSLLGKLVVISVPRLVSPVENGRGIVWEDATVTTRPSYFLTSRSVTQAAENVIQLMGRALFRPPTRDERERTIVLERNEIALQVGDAIRLKEEEDALMALYTDGSIKPTKCQAHVPHEYRKLKGRVAIKRQ